MSCSPAPGNWFCSRTKGDNSLGDADDTEDASSVIRMGKDAGVLICSLIDMIKKRKLNSCLKVLVPRPWLDKWS